MEGVNVHWQKGLSREEVFKIDSCVEIEEEAALSWLVVKCPVGSTLN
jgi:hypothetical protein